MRGRVVAAVLAVHVEIGAHALARRERRQRGIEVDAGDGHELAVDEIGRRVGHQLGVVVVDAAVPAVAVRAAVAVGLECARHPHDHQAGEDREDEPHDHAERWLVERVVAFRILVRDRRASSVSFGGARVVRTFAGASATLAVLFVGKYLPASLPTILAVGLCVTVAIHIVGVIQALRGVRDEDALGYPHHPANRDEVAAAMHDTFARPINIGGSELLTGSSIGVTSAGRGDDRSAAELLRDADTAMYAAKNERSGVRIFDNQFTIYFQPIVSWSRDALASFEVLVRWDHPEYGLIGPDRFLPVVEDSGMMSRLGETVLRESLAQKTVWNHHHGEARNVSVGVNVAERQLIDRSFPDQVAAALEWSGIPAAQLTLEITENVMIERLDDSLAVLRELDDLGVSLVIDDFGTGRSSLAWVKELDMIDAIKIDRSFVSGIPEGHVDLAVIDAIMLIAEALDLDVVAEGVETPEQARTLDGLGVELMQGYLFHRPAPADEIDLSHLISVSAAGRGYIPSEKR